ncbi:MAG: hypothetical protein P4L87_25255 [Formivibrio sp.]|nr:hypothetical protein [Formivibrio sp.]
MRWILLLLLPVWAYATNTTVERARPYLPVLASIAAELTPQVQPATTYAGQIEQESRWKVRAELKTDREYGFGLSQCTVTKRFNCFDEMRQSGDKTLARWQWADRFDPAMNMRVIVLKDKQCLRYAGGATGSDRNAMMLACYNGGGGGLVSDKAICRAKSGCDPGRWWGNVATTSNKSRVKWQGYGQSAFDINRQYPDNIIWKFAPKYTNYMKQ